MFKVRRCTDFPEQISMETASQREREREGGAASFDTA